MSSSSWSQSSKAPGGAGIFGKTAFYVLLIAGALISIFPFYWMFVIATNDRGAVFHIPPLLTIGGEFFNNFQRVLERTDFFQALLNSLFVSSMVTVSVVFFCTLAGYAFAKYEFPFKNALFYFVIATLFVPSQLSVLPTYIIMAKLQWIDTYRALIVPAMVNAFGIFWMRQYAATAVHSELIESGRIDGGGHFRIFWNIAVPVITLSHGDVRHPEFHERMERLFLAARGAEKQRAFYDPNRAAAAFCQPGRPRLRHDHVRDLYGDASAVDRVPAVQPLGHRRPDLRRGQKLKFPA